MTSPSSEKLTRSFTAIGECLMELRHTDGTKYNLSYTGDAFNVAKYMAHYAPQLDLTVRFLSAMGDDPYSKKLLQQWQRLNINTDCVPLLKNKQPGLYLCVNTKSGKIRKYYFRGESAARETFSCPEILQQLNQLAKTQFIFLSSTSMAILDKSGRETLLNFLHKAHNHQSQIFFTSQDVRSLLDKRQSDSLNIMQRLLVYVDVMLGDFAHEQAMFNDSAPDRTIARLHDSGVAEIVLIVDDKTCLLSDKKNGLREEPLQNMQQHLDYPNIIDAFNAGYTIARCHHLTPKKSVAFAQKLAYIARNIKANTIANNDLPELNGVE